MSQLVVDAMDGVGVWTAFEADGTTPSTELTLTPDAAQVRFGEDGFSGRVDGTTAAEGHLLRRALGDVDLTPFEELRLWIRGDRVANGLETTPFYLELRLASAAMPLSDPGNEWHRYLPVSTFNRWELARLDLADLPAAVRSAVNLAQLRCVDATTGFECFLDDVLAVSDDTLRDADAAVVALLDGGVSLDGTPVPALIRHVENPVAETVPLIRITPYAVRRAAAGAASGEARTDFSDEGFLVRAPAEPFELFYELDVFTDLRAEKATVMEFLIDTLSPPAMLVANGTELPIEWLPADPAEEAAADSMGRTPLRVKITARREQVPPQPVRLPEEVLIETDDGAFA